MSLSRCTGRKYSDWEDSWEQGAPKRLRRSLGFAHDNEASFTLTENSMHRDAPRMRSGPASDLSPRIGGSKELCRIFPFVKISCWDTWPPLASSDSVILN